MTRWAVLRIGAMTAGAVAGAVVLTVIAWIGSVVALLLLYGWEGEDQPGAKVIFYVIILLAVLGGALAGARLVKWAIPRDGPDGRD